MDRQQIGLKLTLDALGLPPRLKSFAARLTLQKAIYLAQVAGVQLGYSFHWYLHGPYSPALTRDAFAVVAEINQGTNDAEGWSLDAASQQRLVQLRDHVANVGKAGLPKKLELLASVHFLLNTSAGRGRNSAELVEVLRRFGKDYTQDQVRAAVAELAEHGLVPISS